MAAIQEPSTVDEFRRVAHAFLAGSRLEEGSTAFVVASTVGLRRIQGIYPSVDAAQSAAGDEVDARLGWTREEEHNRVIYPVRVPRSAFPNWVIVMEHPSWTDPVCVAPAPRFRPGTRTFDQIRSAEVRVTWNDDTTTTYELSPDTDAVFITRGAAEMFAYPHYAATFGHAYAEALRDQLMKYIP
jgi:hypothetical protein